MQIGVVLKHGQTVPYAVSDSSVIGQVQTSPDFFHGHARLCVLQIVAQVSSPLFFARQPEPSFPRLCHRVNSFRNNGQNKSDQLFTVDRLWLGHLFSFQFEMYSARDFAIFFGLEFGVVS